METKIRTGRLLKLAKHLETGKLGHKVFDFANYNAEKNGDELTIAVCGYAGCAIGECPIAFPKFWIFDTDGLPTLLESRNSPKPCGREFFSLDTGQFEHLFLPGVQNTAWGAYLGDSTTKEEVAANIRKFCKLVRSGVIQ